MTQRLITELISFCILANVMIWIIKQTAASFPVSYIQGRVLFCFGVWLLLELCCITAQLKCVVKKNAVIGENEQKMLR